MKTQALYWLIVGFLTMFVLGAKCKFWFVIFFILTIDCDYWGVMRTTSVKTA
jgi:hypothetical protein